MDIVALRERYDEIKQLLKGSNTAEFFSYYYLVRGAMISLRSDIVTALLHAPGNPELTSLRDTVTNYLEHLNNEFERALNAHAEGGRRKRLTRRKSHRKTRHDRKTRQTRQTRHSRFRV